MSVKISWLSLFRKFSPIIAIAVSLALFSSSSFSESLITTSDSALATKNSGQRRTFFDTGNRVHWAFYYKNSSIEYASSSDGISWEVRDSIAYDTTDFSLTFREISGTSYVFIANQENSYDVFLTRGTLSTSSISWDSPVTVFDGTTILDNFSSPSINLDSSNYIWIAAKRRNANGMLQINVRRSSNTADGLLSAWGSISTLGMMHNTLGDLAILALSNSEMMLICGNSSENILAWRYNGNTWSEANASDSYGWRLFSESGLNGTVRAIAAAGSDIYIGGEFTIAFNNAGPLTVNRITRYSTSENRFYQLGAGTFGVNSFVRTIVTTGTDVYIGGQFTVAYNSSSLTVNRVTRYSSANNTFYTLGAGSFGVNNIVYAIAISGTDIYIGGAFTSANNSSPLSVNYITRYSTSNNTFYALGDGSFGLNNSVRAIAISGTDIFIGGEFTTANNSSSITVNYITRYSSYDNTFYALGDGSFGVNNVVYAIAYDQTDLYIGGDFTIANNSEPLTVNRITRYSTSDNTFYVLGGGNCGFNSTVNAIAVSGTDIYISGAFLLSYNASPITSNRITRYSKTNNTFYTVGAGSYGVDSTIFAMVISGTDIYLGGLLKQANNSSSITVNQITRYSINENFFYGLGSGSFGLNGSIHAIAVNGTDIYLGGAFTIADNSTPITVNRIVRYSTLDNTFYRLGDGTYGVGNTVWAIATEGNHVYIGGAFATAYNSSSLSVNNITRYDSSENKFYRLGSGSFGVNSTVRAIAISGTNIYIGGDFSSANNSSPTTVNYITRYSASDNIFYQLGAGIGLNGTVRTIAVTGTDVYIGGDFTSANNSSPTSVNYVTRYSSSDNTFYQLGSGTCGVNGSVRAIAITGTDVYIGGLFTTAYNEAALSVNRITRYSSSANIFYTLGAGSFGVGQGVYAIAISGTDVYVGGNFTTANNSSYLTVDYITRYSTSDNTFYSIGGALNNYVAVIAIADTAVYVGGVFNPYFQVYTRSLAANTGNFSQISAVRNPSTNDINLLYRDESDDLSYRRYDSSESSWINKVLLHSGTISSPALSINPSSGVLSAFFLEANEVKYMIASSPYGSSKWSDSPTIVYSLGTNDHLLVGEQTLGDNTLVVWTNGTSNPYSVLCNAVMSPPSSSSVRRVILTQ